MITRSRITVIIVRLVVMIAVLIDITEGVLALIMSTHGSHPSWHMILAMSGAMLVTIAGSLYLTDHD